LQPQTSAIFKELKITFLQARYFFVAGIKAQYDKDGKIILMGENIGDGVEMLQLISFYSAGVWISTEPPCVCTCS
jgi:hypothetical protein